MCSKAKADKLFNWVLDVNELKQYFKHVNQVNRNVLVLLSWLYSRVCLDMVNVTRYCIRFTIAPSSKSAQKICLPRLTSPTKMVGVICRNNFTWIMIAVRISLLRVVEWIYVRTGMREVVIVSGETWCFLNNICGIRYVRWWSSRLSFRNCYDFFLLHPHTRDDYTCSEGHRSTILERSLLLECDGWAGRWCVKS